MKFFQLPGAVILSVSGPQAERYLQIRLTNDVKLLTGQRAMLAAALTPQGRTEALCTVLSLAKNSYTLFADGGDPKSILDGIKRFVVTERIDFADISSQFRLLHLIPGKEKEDMGALVPTPPYYGSEFSRISTASAEFIARRRSLDWGWDIVISREKYSAFLEKLSAQEACELSSDQRELLRMRAGLPEFPIEINAAHIFAEAGLQQAVSFTKGCYTGQEVIAKIDALGKPPRILRHLKLPGIADVKIGAAVTSPSESRPAGEVLSAAQDTEHDATWIFASIRSAVDPAATKLFIGNVEVIAGASSPATSG